MYILNKNYALGKWCMLMVNESEGLTYHLTNIGKLTVVISSVSLPTDMLLSNV